MYFFQRWSFFQKVPWLSVNFIAKSIAESSCIWGILTTSPDFSSHFYFTFHALLLPLKLLIIKLSLNHHLMLWAQKNNFLFRAQILHCDSLICSFCIELFPIIMFCMKSRRGKKCLYLVELNKNCYWNCCSVPCKGQLISEDFFSWLQILQITNEVSYKFLS